MSTATKRRCKPPSASGKSKLDRYAVKFVLIDSITPSPENDEIYGPIEHDDSMDNLIDSMRRKGMEEPILLTADRFILSGHRRHYAAKHLGWKQVPVRVRPDIRRIGNLEYHRELIEYNPQRVKTVGSILREALLRDNDAADTYAAIRERREASLTVDADFMTVSGEKEIEPISRKQQEFLAAVQRVLEALRPFWPVTIRKVRKRPAEHIGRNRRLGVGLANGEIKPDASGGGGGREVLPRWRREESLAVGSARRGSRPKDRGRDACMTPTG